MAPNTLGSENTQHVIPNDVAQIMTQARYFAVEKVTSARRLLRKLDKSFPIDASTFFVLNKKTDPASLSSMLLPLTKGENLIVISEAGCPGIADPGAELVALAHENNILVEPLVGPSSILLALIASGFNGQHFCFSGYLPKDSKNRCEKLKELEKIATQKGITQIFMDTPFRNVHILEDMIKVLNPETKVCIACNLTTKKSFSKTLKIKDINESIFKIDKHPTMFCIGK